MSSPEVSDNEFVVDDAPVTGIQPDDAGVAGALAPDDSRSSLDTILADQCLEEPVGLPTFFQTMELQLFPPEEDTLNDPLEDLASLPPTADIDLAGGSDRPYQRQAKRHSSR